MFGIAGGKLECGEVGDWPRPLRFERLLRMGNKPHHLLCWLVFALRLIRDRPQKATLCPGQVGHFHDHFGPHPMHFGKLERRPEAVVAGWWGGKRHLRHLSGASTSDRRFSSRSFMPVPARPA